MRGAAALMGVVVAGPGVAQAGGTGAGAAAGEGCAGCWRGWRISRSGVGSGDGSFISYCFLILSALLLPGRATVNLWTALELESDWV